MLHSHVVHFVIVVFCDLWLCACVCVRAYAQVENPGQLLQLLVKFGRVQEAGQLAIQYMRALLGTGREEFAVKVRELHVTPQLSLQHA